MDLLKEEIRILKARAEFIQNKIRDCEHHKQDLIKQLYSKIATLDYEAVKKELESEFLNLVEKRELPWTKIYMSMIYNRIANIHLIAKNQEDITPETQEVINIYTQIQRLLQIRIADLEDETNRIKDALAKGIPLYDLYQIKEDEIKEKSLDSQFLSLTSHIHKALQDAEAHIVQKIISARNLMAKLEQEHGNVKTITHFSEEILKFHKEITKHLTQVEMLLFIAGGIAAIVAAPEAIAGISAISLVEKILSKSDQAENIARFIDDLKMVQEKMETLSHVPGFDPQYLKTYQEVQDRYATMIQQSITQESRSKNITRRPGYEIPLS